MNYLLDTNICSAHFRRSTGLTHRFIQYSSRLAIPSIVLGELYAGAYHCVNPRPLLQKIDELLLDVQVLPFDNVCAEQFGILRGGLLQHGISVAGMDLMIAAVAIAHDYTLVTHNTSDFQNIPGLQMLDWLD
jgi:tRNA(fMet)-specific endonuclease VapC